MPQKSYLDKKIVLLQIDLSSVPLFCVEILHVLREPSRFFFFSPLHPNEKKEKKK